MSAYRFPVLAAALGLSLALAGGQAAAQAKKREVRFGLPVAAINSGYCMFPAATRLGYFADEGLDVKINNIAGSATVVQTTASGRLDIGAATPEPILTAYSKGDPVVMVYNYIRKPTGSVAVLAESPIKTLADLKGKRLGAATLASGNIMLTNGLLSKVGIDGKKEVTYLSVGVGAQALQALRSGHADGLVLFDSLYAQIESQGAKLRYIYGEGQDLLFSTQFVVRKDLAEREPEVVRGFGRAVAKATLFAKDNPEACVRMMWQEFPASRVAGMAEADQLKQDVAVLVKRMELLLPPEGPGKGWGYYEPSSITAWNEFAAEGGIIEKKLTNLDGLYTNAFVADFNKFDRKAVADKARATPR
jgi:NitT/TauT family transport system substrate-binding protein